MDGEKHYKKIGEELAKQGAVQSQMFGKPCLKIEGKAFACLFEGEMVFKLGGEVHAEALGLKGSKLFDPSGKGRPMKEWVQVPVADSSKWSDLAEKALSYVRAAAK